MISLARAATDRALGHRVFRVALGCLAIGAVVALACGDSAPSSTALTELGRLAPLQPGRPVLVFVYTDG